MAVNGIKVANKSTLCRKDRSPLGVEEKSEKKL